MVRCFRRCSCLAGVRKEDVVEMHPVSLLTEVLGVSYQAPGYSAFRMTYSPLCEVWAGAFPVRA